MTISRLRTLWPVLTLMVSGGLLVGAHAFERIGGYAPCPLCYSQRHWHWGVLAMSVLALILQRTALYRPRLAVFIIGLVLTGSALMAGFHVGVEQGVFTYVCAVPEELGDLTIDWDAPLEVPSCDDPAWTLMGISMAGYNAIISALMALASFAVALWPEKKS